MTKEVLNIDIKILKGSISFDKLAKQVGVSKPTLVRWFNRIEMDPVQRGRVIKAINEIKEEDAK